MSDEMLDCLTWALLSLNCDNCDNCDNWFGRQTPTCGGTGDRHRRRRSSAFDTILSLNKVISWIRERVVLSGVLHA